MPAVSRLARANAWARRLKPLSAARSLGSPGSLARTRRAYRDLGIRKLPFASVRHAEVSGSRSEKPRLDRDRGLEELQSDPRFDEQPAQVQEALRAFPERGYAVLERLFTAAEVDAVNEQIDGLLGGGGLHYHHRSPRVMNSWRKSPAVQQLVADPRLTDVLTLILGREALLFQTINFIVGSEQGAHSDAFHMMTEPPGFLLGVWVALEDIESDAGPVFYLPGSHRLPYVMSEDLEAPARRPLMVPDKPPAYARKMNQVARDFDAEKVPFEARKGDVLVWHHNLLHGGGAIEREGATRKSLVAHFFADGVLGYHEVTERPALIPAFESSNNHA